MPQISASMSELAVASREVAVASALDLGGRRVEIVHLGRGHTDGDLVVVVPDANVIFAGDLIESADALVRRRQFSARVGGHPRFGDRSDDR